MAGRDIINRILGFLTGTALVVCGAVALLIVTNAVKTNTLAPTDWFREQFRHLDALTGTDETVAIAIAVAAVAVGAIVVLLELIPAARRERELMVRDAAGNTVALAPESVALVAEQAAREVAGVLDASMAVREGTDGVVISGNVAVLDDVNLAEKTGQITERVKSALEGRLGVKVARLAMKMRLANAEDAEKIKRGGRRTYPWSHGHEKAGSTTSER